MRKIATIQRSQSAIEILERMILDGGALRFATLTDMAAPQPWLVDEEGRVLGHALLVDDQDFEQAIDAVALSMEDVLLEDWRFVEEYEACAVVFRAATEASSMRQQSFGRRMRLQFEARKARSPGT